jgi:hypothetical protein
VVRQFFWEGLSGRDGLDVSIVEWKGNDTVCVVAACGTFCLDLAIAVPSRLVLCMGLEQRRCGSATFDRIG